MANVYVENGYRGRDDYLENLADEFGVDIEIVFGMADALGPSEDFDGLVAHLEDMSY